MDRTVFFLLIIIICCRAHKNKDSVFIPYGLAQYSLVWSYSSVSDSQAIKHSTADHPNKIGIYFGFIVKINPKLQVQFQFGNDWASINKADYPFDNSVMVSNKYYPVFSYPCFHLAYIQWKPGIFYLQTGKVPLRNSGPLDLLERSLAADNYQGAAFIGWSDATNNSLLGVKFGLHLFKHSFSPEFFATVFQKSESRFLFSNADSSIFLYVLNLPFRWNNFNLSPQFAFIYNKNLNQHPERINHEAGWGFNSNFILNKTIRFHLMSAWARLINYNSKSPRFSFSSAGNYSGFECMAGTAVNSGNFLIEFDIKYSNATDIAHKNSKSHFLFCDIKSSIAAHKHISIIPRFRFFHSIFPGSTESRNFLFCPEVIFRSHF